MVKVRRDLEITLLARNEWQENIMGYRYLYEGDVVDPTMGAPAPNPAGSSEANGRVASCAR
jgi:hypothetical protein